MIKNQIKSFLLLLSQKRYKTQLNESKDQYLYKKVFVSLIKALCIKCAEPLPCSWHNLTFTLHIQ